jgi:hypothetical protein
MENALRIPFSTDSWAKAVSAAARDLALPVVARSSAKREAALKKKRIRPAAQDENFTCLDKSCIWRRLNLKRS